jgi:hypothetical protein
VLVVFFKRFPEVHLVFVFFKTQQKVLEVCRVPFFPHRRRIGLSPVRRSAVNLMNQKAAILEKA